MTLSEEELRLRFGQGLVDVKQVESILKSGEVSLAELKEGHNYLLLVSDTFSRAAQSEIARYAKRSFGVNMIVVALKKDQQAALFELEVKL